MLHILEILYALSSLLLAVYGLNSLALLWLYRRGRGSRPAPPDLESWPRVTVQLPVYNESHTIERLLAAVRALDYPQDRLQVQVLDDSTDETRQIVAAWAARLSAEGLDWEQLHRGDREGYKAGALAAGLEHAKGEFIAVFDADFAPEPDFLRRTLPYFAQADLACVQARWGHLNREYSTLTRLQALAIDGHFIVEQTARSRNGLFLNFNGSAGIWRRASLLEAGGWSADTLTEDLDLSYRAQLRGWRIAYLPDLIVPAELPAQMAAFKRQQARWAKGSLQTARKTLGPLIASSQSWRVKVEGVLHLTHYLVHPLILSTLALALPLSVIGAAVLKWVPLLTIAALGPPLLYLLAAAPEGPHGWERLRLLPGLILLGIGLSLNNSRAALAGLFRPERGEFTRTPKFAVRRPGERWEASRYALPQDRWVWVEMSLGIMAAGAILLAGNRWGYSVWLAIYALSYLYVSGVSFWQSARRSARHQPSSPASGDSRAERSIGP